VEEVMPDPSAHPGDKLRSSKPRSFRIAAILVLLFVAAYTAAVILGLPKDKRIDGSTLGLIGIGSLIAVVLFRPDIVDRVTRLEVAGWKIDIEQRQEKQDKQLQDIQLILPILLPENERKHLLNLASQNARPYQGNDAVRTELRRLRSLKLINMKPNQEIGRMTDGKQVILGDFVELTDLGRRWVDRIKEIEAEAVKPAETTTRTPGD
jgi:hypothetical protein